MKRFYAIVFATFYFQYATAQANKSLSNLNDTTAVNVTILPGNDNTISIGSPSKSWRNLFLDGDIYIGGVRLIAHEHGTGEGNTAVGVNVLHAATIGYHNTGIGYNALYSITTGYDNAANGYYALRSNTFGNFNTANGSNALRSNTYGNSNTANGHNALYSNTVGGNNTASGVVALYYNTTGDNNTANGTFALYYNTTGDRNTANGVSALYYNTDGYLNTAFGYKALYSNTTGYRNTANGAFALTSNTTGYYNTANGNFSLTSNTTGTSNTANGLYALTANTTGDYNAANGVEALYNNTTGNANTATGRRTLYHNTTGSYNTALGYLAGVSTGNLSNATALGYGAIANASNRVRVGNTAITSIGGQVNWTTFSDGRYKKNIQEDVKGLSFIKALRPVTYITDIKALNAYYHAGRGNDSTYKNMQTEMAIAIEEGSKIVYTGFVAQEVEAVAKQLGYDFSGVDRPKTKDGIYGLRYGDFVVPLVKAVQELSKMNDDKDAAIDSLKKQNEILNARLDKIEKLLTRPSQNSANSSSKLIELNNAPLVQNSPNPFTNTTTIAYSLPQKFSSAKIIITDRNGKQLKQLNLSGAGKGTVHVDASTFASGTYNYALYVDGKFVVSNQMLLAR